MFVVSCSYFPKLKCQNRSWAAKQDIAQQHSKIRHSHKKMALSLARKAQRRFPHCGTEGWIFQCPLDIALLSDLVTGLDTPRNAGIKMGCPDGFAVQRVPYVCKVGRSALVRWRGGAGLAHPPGVTQDSSSELSGAQNSRGKSGSVPVFPTSPLQANSWWLNC